MTAPSRRERILVVDDEPQILTALSDALESFDVLTTSDPEHAISLAAADPELAVVLTDERMPGITGNQLLKRIREISKASRMLITGYADLDSVVRAVNDGNICGFVTKPWGRGDLQHSVQRAAVEFRLNRDLELERHERAEAEAALRTSEERLRLAFQASSAGLFDLNLVTGEFVYSASAFDAAPGSADRVEGDLSAIEQRVHPEDLPKLREAMAAHLYERKPFSALQLRGLDPSASLGYRWFELNAQAAWDAQGRPLRLVGSAQDIDELKQAQTRLLQAQKLEAIGQLAAGVAHEINTPTQYITDNVTFLSRALEKVRHVLEAYQVVAQAARDGRSTAAPLAALDSLVQSTKLDYLLRQAPRALQQSLEGLAQVSGIVRAMREFSHPSAAEKHLVDLHEIIESSSAVTNSEWKYVAEMRFDFDRSLPPIAVFRNELSQVVVNLIVNAAHAVAAARSEAARSEADERSGIITVATKRLPKAAEIRVSDSGAGIPKDIQGRVFEPFFTTKEVGKGTGQGLAISYAVVKRHGGSITFETVEGKGTTFIVRLPVEPETLDK